MSNNEKIIKKVKGLLTLSRDHKDDEESQSAFIMAQKLMIKYNLSALDVDDYESDEALKNMAQVHVTVAKRLFWWERQLARIIAQNFRVKNFLTTSYGKKQITFFGYGGDLELAKEMYILAYDVLVSHSSEYIKNHYKTTNEERSRYYTESIKSSYINGFLSGLSERFEEQVSQLREEFPLMVLIPEEVEEAYKEMSESWSSTKLSKPNVKSAQAYKSGFKNAKSVDFTRSTLGGI